jgi:TolB-like protein
MNKLQLATVILAVTVFSLGLSGCAGYQTSTRTDAIQDVDIVAMSYDAADILMARAGTLIDGSKTIVAASFVNIDNLDNSSSFGRIVSQQLASRFTQKGYKVTEMLLRNNIYIKEGEGEFLLSRTLKSISAQHNVQAVIVGTYAIAANNIYVVAKLVRATDSIVLSSHDYTFPVGPDIKQLIRHRR